MSKLKPVIIIVLICVLALIGCILVDRYTKLTYVEVTGGSYYPASEIQKIVLDGEDETYTWLVYLKKKLFGSIGPIPFVEKVDIEFVDKNSIRIQVYDKVIIGCVKHMGKYLHFDREGIVVESSSERMKDIPEITGVEFERVVLGEKLQVEDKTIFDRIMNLVLLLQKEEISCDEINFDLRNNAKIYFDGNEAFLGSGTVYDKQLSCLKQLIEAAGDKKYIYDLKNYDSSTGEVTARLKEEEGTPEQGVDDNLDK